MIEASLRGTDSPRGSLYLRPDLARALILIQRGHLRSLLAKCFFQDSVHDHVETQETHTRTHSPSFFSSGKALQRDRA